MRASLRPKRNTQSSTNRSLKLGGRSPLRKTDRITDQSTNHAKPTPATRNYRPLFLANLVAGSINLVTGLILAGIATDNSAFELYTGYPETNQSVVRYMPRYQKAGRVYQGHYSAAFLLLSALDHLAVSSVFWSSYKSGLARGWNPFRWIEYAMSAAIMRVLIAELSGILETHLLVAIAGLTATTMLFGLLQEYSNRRLVTPVDTDPDPDDDDDNNGTLLPTHQPTTWLPFVFGLIPHFFAWGIIYSFFNNIASSDGQLPDFVYAVMICLTLTDASFALLLALQQAKIGWFRSTIRGELGFIALSLLSKQLLTWLTYGGVSAQGQSRTM